MRSSTLAWRPSRWGAILTGNIILLVQNPLVVGGLNLLLSGWRPEGLLRADRCSVFWGILYRTLYIVGKLLVLFARCMILLQPVIGNQHASGTLAGKSAI